MKSFFQHLLILLILIFFSTSIYSQWNQYPVNAPYDINCVGVYNSNLIYAGYGSFLFKSDDGGNSWVSIELKDQSNSYLLGSIIYDIEFISNTEAIAVGMILMGNDEVILRTSDGGVTWSFANVYPSGTWPRVQNKIHFVTSTIGYTVGSNGRILRTNNGGVSWTLISAGVPNNLNIKDVYFTSTNNGITIGGEHILKTNNGGNSWTSTVFSGENFNAIHFSSILNGYIVGDNNKLMRTTDGGNSWNDVPLIGIPNVFDVTSVFFNTDIDGYITGSNGIIYHTTDGGVSWEKYETSSKLNDIFFDNSNDGYVVGNNGKFLHTSTGSQAFKPIANFELPSLHICQDSILYLNNYGDPTLSYKWMINDSVISTSFNTQTTIIPRTLIHSYFQYDTISLIVSNGTDYDTLSYVVTLKESLNFTISGSVGNTQLCAGQSTQILVDSDWGIDYSLIKNGVRLGTIKPGVNGILTFNTGPISASTSICIKGVKEVPGCGSNTETWCPLIEVMNPDAATIITPIDDTICVNTGTDIVVYNSEPNISYQLYEGSNVIGAPHIGNGSDLIISTPNLTESKTFHIKATAPFGCKTNYSSIHIEVQDPAVFWTSNTFNPEINEEIVLINNSQYPDGTFLWNFGNNASQSTSNLRSPTDIYITSTGLQDISLKYTTPLGCIETVQKTLNVINPVQTDSCSAINFSSHNIASLSSIIRDKDNNIYSLYNHNFNNSNVVYSNNGDTLHLSTPEIVGVNQGYTLIKHNDKNVPMWATYLRSTSSMSKGILTSDSLGHIYIACFQGNGAATRIYSSDGSYETNQTANNSVIVVKYNSDGILKWNTEFQETYSMWKTSIKVDNDQNVFANGQFRSMKYLSDGTKDWEITGDFSDMEPDNNGGVYVLMRIGLIIKHYDSNGNLLTSSPTLNHINNSVIGTQYLRKDENGGLYVGGNFRGNFVFANDTLTDIYGYGQSHEDAYLAKFSNDLNPLWIKQFKVPSAVTLQGMDVGGNTVIMGLRNFGADINYIQGGDTLYNAENAYYLFKCDTLGNSDELVKFYEASTSNLGPGSTANNVSVWNNGKAFDFGFTFKNDFVASTGTAFNRYNKPGMVDNGINTVQLACAFNKNPSTDIPIAYYSGPIYACVNEQFSFTDGSINNPTQWDWSLPGANSTTSTDQNPNVVYSTPGQYQVSLTATNSFGQSNVYISYIIVDDLPISSIHGVSDVCIGNNITLNADGAYDFEWPDGSMSSYINIINVQEDTVVNLIVSNNGCSITLSHSISIDVIPNSVTYSFEFSDTLCSSANSFSLPTPSPAGGTFLATNWTIVGDTIYNPGNAQPGDDIITYRYYSPLANCFLERKDTIHILDDNVWGVISTSNNGCVGSVYNLIANYSNGIQYVSWSFDGGISSDSTALHPDVLYNNTGTYNITLNSKKLKQCAGYTDTKTITIESIPSPPVPVSSVLSACNGDTLTFAVHPASNQVNTYYQWSSPNGGTILSTSNNSSSITATGLVGSVIFEVTASTACGISSPTLFTTIENDPPIQPIAMPETTEICQGDTVKVSIDTLGLSSQSLNYNWTLLNGGAIISGQSSPTIYIVGGNGNIDGEVVATNNCGTSIAASFSTVVHPLSVVDLGNNIDTLVCIDHPSIQLSGLPSGGTWSGSSVVGNEFDPSIGAGNYSITYEVTDANGCFNSDSIIIIIENCLGIPESNKLNDIQIYPNPATKEVYVSVNSSISNSFSNYQLYLIDALGRKVWESINPQLNNINTFIIPVERLDKGAYILKIKNNNSVEVKSSVVIIQ